MADLPGFPQFLINSNRFYCYFDDSALASSREEGKEIREK